MHEWLNNHPQIFLPKCKELHFFDKNYQKGDEWYMNKFKEAGNDGPEEKAEGEAEEAAEVEAEVEAEGEDEAEKEA